MSRPGRFFPEKENRYPFYRRLDGPQGYSGGVGKISPLPRFDLGTVHLVEGCYTGCATPAGTLNALIINTANSSMEKETRSV
jgi:hypothetical protein